LKVSFSCRDWSTADSPGFVHALTSVFACQ
jgi:hypothetical protein